MDVLLSGLSSHISSLGGYAESRNIQNGSTQSAGAVRSATLVIRIPSAQLDSFVQQIDDTSNVVSTKETSDDVTLEYADIEGRLKMLQAEEKRLLKFLSEANSITEMLEVETQLTQVQSDIESLTAQLKTYDNLVDHGTVTLQITEVEVYTPVAEPGMWQKIADTFMDSLASLGAICQGSAGVLPGLQSLLPGDGCHWRRHCSDRLFIRPAAEENRQEIRNRMAHCGYPWVSAVIVKKAGGVIDTARLYYIYQEIRTPVWQQYRPSARQ